MQRWPARGLLASVVATVLLAGAGCPERAGEPETRGVLLVTVDGLVPSELSLFGGSRDVPALTRIADGGRAFPDAWTTVPMTRPAVATVLTGLVPARHGVRDDVGTPLAPGVPTLATRLGEAGFKTAAFPDSAYLGRNSGLLDGFDDVDAPPMTPVGPFGRVPVTRDAGETARDVAGWLETVARGERWFAWVHFSQPQIDQLIEFERARRERIEAEAAAKGKGQPPEPREIPNRDALTVAAFDTALGAILDAVAARGDLDASAIAVAATMADVRGDGALRPPGAGFSLDAAAIEVPVVLRLPGGTLAGDGPVWAPDLAPTLAEVAGLDPVEGDGVSLLAARPPDRVRRAWSWAPEDQLAWPALRVASDGTTAASAGATEPPAPRLALEDVGPLLAARGIEPQPVPDDRPGIPDGRARVELVESLTFGRMLLRGGGGPMAPAAYEAALARDPRAFAPLLEKGQVLFLSGRTEPALEALAGLVALYPTRPEAVHWYAHAIWSESWQDAETMLLAVLPHAGEDADLLYDLACSHSLGGDLDGSEAYLRRAIEAGFRNWQHIEADPDLRHLREAGRLGAVVQESR